MYDYSDFDRAFVNERVAEFRDQVERRIAGRPLDFDLVHARIAAYLSERSQRLAVAQYIARLAAAAKVTGVDLASPGDLRVH